MGYLSAHTVKFNNKKYCVMLIKYKKYNVPVVIDYNNYHFVRLFGDKLYSNSKGIITCNYLHNNKQYRTRLHEIIMFRHNNPDIPPEKFVNAFVTSKKEYRITLMHINKCGLDNRTDNLTYGRTNLNKKKRKTDIHGILSNDIPSYIWYSKACGTHGEYFTIKLPGIKWKTSSSKKVPLWHKLEAAKLKMKELTIKNPEIFAECAMNGGYSQTGKKMLETFYKIVAKIRTISVNEIMPVDFTQKLLCDKTNTNIFYYEETDNCGDYYIIQKPNLMRSSSSKRITTDEKYKQLMRKIWLMNDTVEN